MTSKRLALIISSLAFAPLLLGLGVVARSSADAGGKASIKGRVFFEGAPPKQKSKRRTGVYCQKNKGNAKDVDVTAGKLAGVLVRIKPGTAGIHAAPKQPVIINQTNCEYEPRVAGVMVGQQIAIKNSDKTMHNVHGYDGKKTWFNRSQPKGAADIKQDVSGSGKTLLLKCDVHQWMRAYLPVSDHPYFATSDGEGSFEINKVPTGNYELEAWHPVLGKQTTKVKVGAKGGTAEFRFKK